MSPKMQKSFTENNLGLVAGFYAPSGKGIPAEAKVDTTAKDQLLLELGLTPAQKAILGL